MARRRRFRALFLSLLFPALFVGVLGWLTYAQVQRVRLRGPFIAGAVWGFLGALWKEGAQAYPVWFG